MLPELASQILARQDEVKALAGRYRFAERMVLTSRGYGYPTAKEAALKPMETSYIPALSYSGADLLHGPLATTTPPGARSPLHVLVDRRERLHRHGPVRLPPARSGGPCRCGVLAAGGASRGLVREGRSSTQVSRSPLPSFQSPCVVTRQGGSHCD